MTLDIVQSEKDTGTMCFFTFFSFLHVWTFFTFSSFSMRGFPPCPESESDEMSLCERSRGRNVGLEKRSSRSSRSSRRSRSSRSIGKRDSFQGNWNLLLLCKNQFAPRVSIDNHVIETVIFYWNCANQLLIGTMSINYWFVPCQLIIMYTVNRLTQRQSYTSKSTELISF